MNQQHIFVRDNSSMKNLGRFESFTRIPVCNEATPLENLERLPRANPSVRLYVKRDDCNHLGFGGNKVRQVEYYFGDAICQGADTVLITGAVQSNFARTTAALAAKLGMQCHIQLESRVDNPSESYLTSGNVLLNRLFGAELHYYGQGEDEQGADNRIRDIADDLKRQGRKPYIIPLAPGSKPFGALGYVRAAIELLEQIKQQDLKINEIVVASGSGNTHAGLLFGLRALGSKIVVTGVCVRRSASVQIERISKRCDEIANLLETNSLVVADDIALNDKHFQPGYGKATDAVWNAILTAARSEGLVVDPTYTGKAMATFLAKAQSAQVNEGILFIHTGGTPSIFGYQGEFERYFNSIH